MIVKMDEFENTQKINLSKIVCDICRKVNKANSYNNEFLYAYHAKKIYAHYVN